MDFTDNLILQTAIEAVVKACSLSRNVQNIMLDGDSISKQDRSPVTVADYGAQAVVSHELAARFPDIPLMGEEDSSQLTLPQNNGIKNLVMEHVREINASLSEREILQAIDRGIYEGGASGRFWCLDPIDGTKGFLRREQYATALALIEDGEVELGVLGCPNLPGNLNDPGNSAGSLFMAVRGQGAHTARIDSHEEWNEIHVDDQKDTVDAKFCESVESAHSSHDHSKMIAEALNVQSSPVRMDSQCKYGIVARGDASIYLRLPKGSIEPENSDRYIEKIWDHAAGSIIIEEAGGSVSDIYGRKLNFAEGRTMRKNVGVIVTNGILHERVLAAVQSVLGIF